MHEQETPVTEWAPFSLKPDVTEEQFLSASRELQEGFLEQSDGFLRRELLKRSDREFVDLLRWSSRHHLEAAMSSAMNHPSCRKYFELMEPPEPGTEMVIATLFRDYRSHSTTPKKG